MRKRSHGLAPRRSVKRSAPGLPVALLAWLPLASCRSGDAGLGSTASGPRLHAIARAAEAGDRSAIPAMIEALESDDPALRLVAIRSLERLTGTTRGYDHAAPEWIRREGVERWIAWASEDRPRP